MNRQSHAPLLDGTGEKGNRQDEARDPPPMYRVGMMQKNPQQKRPASSGRVIDDGELAIPDA